VGDFAFGSGACGFGAIVPGAGVTDGPALVGIGCNPAAWRMLSATFFKATRV
jgi:hypothetical protein